MRILICGGRTFENSRLFDAAMHVIVRAERRPGDSDVIVIHGGASGADALADRWARLQGFRVEVYLAEWKSLGRAAGPVRNQRMIDEGRPEVVVAFPGGAGTRDMIKRASAAKARIVVVDRAPQDSFRLTCWNERPAAGGNA